MLCWTFSSKVLLFGTFRGSRRLAFFRIRLIRLLQMLFGFTAGAAGGVTCVDTESVDGVLDGTETLEENDVPPGSGTESHDGLGFSCRDGGGGERKKLSRKSFSK